MKMLGVYDSSFYLQWLIFVAIGHLNTALSSTRNDISAYQPSIISKIASNIINKASTKTLPNRLYTLNDLKANSELKDEIAKKPIPYESDIRGYTLKLSRKQKRQVITEYDEYEDDTSSKRVSAMEYSEEDSSQSTTRKTTRKKFGRITGRTPKELSSSTSIEVITQPSDDEIEPSEMTELNESTSTSTETNLSSPTIDIPDTTTQSEEGVHESDESTHEIIHEITTPYFDHGGHIPPSSPEPEVSKTSYHDHHDEEHPEASVRSRPVGANDTTYRTIVNLISFFLIAIGIVIIISYGGYTAYKVRKRRKQDDMDETEPPQEGDEEKREHVAQNLENMRNKQQMLANLGRKL